MNGSKKITNEKTPLLGLKMNSPNYLVLGASSQNHMQLPEPIQIRA